MEPHQQEATVADVRLHWGIFIPSFFLLFLLGILTLPILLLVRILASLASQINPQHPPSSSWLLFLLIPFAAIFGFALFVTLVAYLKSDIKLTDRRLIFRSGLLSRISGELPLENVESTFLIEPFLGRLCGYGTVAVTSVGGRTFPLRYIGSPQIFHTTLQGAVANTKTVQRVAVKQPTAPQPPQDDASRYMPKG